MFQHLSFGGMLLAAAIVVMAAGLYLLLPPSSLIRRRAGSVLVVLGTGAYLAHATEAAVDAEQILFWLLAGFTVLAACLSMAMPNAVYAALWFAATLGGVASLMFWLGAQFLGAVTIIIYAGAIVVMFLFVIMLAQPGGRALYDRISWSGSAKVTAVVLAAILPAVLVVWPLQDATLPAPVHAEKPEAFTGAVSPDSGSYPPQTAMLGRDFYSRYWVHLELAGTLLLAALVGATVIVLYGRTSRTPASSQISKRRVP
ncbi:MAG: hypothetical protein KatS3mg110_1048 [Pirellulaceae bacterium]|nr:MAG: hypothetical protein KatS3mg110_1048 [Pirellulaceae bacterium]